MAVTSPSAVGSTAVFTGFTPAAVRFLVELADHNDRAWFQPRKADYERLLKEPLEALIAALAVRFAARGVPLEDDPKRSPFRIYRDTRFSKDKSPYKTHLGASFPWTEGAAATSPRHSNEPHAPRHEGAHGYFHFQPGEMFVGGGMWMPEKPRLDAFRRVVADEPDRVRAIFEAADFAGWFGNVHSHESFKRVPPGYPADHPLADMLRWKDVAFGRQLADADVHSPDLSDLIAEGYQTALPVFRFLATLG